MDIFVGLVAAIAAGAVTLPQTVYSVKQQSNVIIERFGRFNKIQGPGLHVKIPFIDKKAGHSDLRIQQLDLNVETKTKDNVFVRIAVSIQYSINAERVYDAFYKLSDHKRQMTSYVFDTIRASVPKLTLDETFEKKDDIAKDVKLTIGSEMSEFGYNIINTLISDVNPDEKVKASMNEINAAQRHRAAATELAQADKIRAVTEAEGRAEAQKLQGVGLANQRKAIIEGFAESMNELKDKGISESNVTSVILFTQYLDTLQAMADKGTNSIMLPSGPSGMNDMLTQIQQGVLQGSTSAASINKHVENGDSK
jgi:regulator of protease activity HflC (stomatin/prohibitin superfamily)